MRSCDERVRGHLRAARRARRRRRAASPGARRVSLVDCVSFATTRELRLDTAFAFDRDFTDQGFRTLP